MRTSFNFGGLVAALAGKGRHVALRAAVGALLVANLIAAVMVFHPFGGTPEDLARQVAELRRQVTERRARVERTRSLVAKVKRGRSEGDRFVASYFMSRRTAYSAIVSEISDMAQKSGLRIREHTFSYQPIEGSETLSMLTITGNYEGTYQELVQFVNLVDKSPRLLIIEALQAAPQQAAKMLNVSLKLNAFVKEEGTGL